MSDVFDDMTEQLNVKELLENAQDKSDPVSAVLTHLSGPYRGRSHVLRHGANVIGRSAAVGVQIKAPGVSRRHAEVREADGVYAVRDLGSKNGTILNGALVEGSTELRDGDRISVGIGTVLRFSQVDALEEQVSTELFEQATRDPLTAAHNRRYLDERMNSEWPWAQRHKRACSVALFDLDHFKLVNDNHGHAAGDHVLREFARLVRGQLRQEDVFARIGGEEFLVLFRETTVTDATAVAERIRRALAEHVFEHAGRQLQISVSIGVAGSLEGGVDSAESLMERADARLYRAKERGRNCTVGANDVPSASP